MFLMNRGEGGKNKKQWTNDLPAADKAVAPSVVEQEWKEERK